MKKRNIIVFVITIVIVAAIVSGGAIFLSHEATKPSENIFTGMAETAEIDVSAKIPGRIHQLAFEEGSLVGEGDTLAIFESTELEAKVGQAKAALNAAKAKFALARNGLRPQEKDAAERLYLQAKSQADLMEKTWTRIQKLSNDSVVSSQERDQIEAQYLAAKEGMEAAKAKLSMAHEGSRTEDQDAARALVAQAQNAYEEAIAWENEQIIVSPISGEIAKKIVHRGEVVGAGAPIVTLIDPKDIWVVLTIKETELKKFKMGSVFWGKIPALGDTLVDFYVSHISPMGDFATWRPTNQKGGFDIKTFEIHVRPRCQIDGLRAGMSVNFISDVK